MPSFTNRSTEPPVWVSECAAYSVAGVTVMDKTHFEAWYREGSNKVMLAMADTPEPMMRLAELHEQGAIDLINDGPFPLDYRKAPPNDELRRRTEEGDEARREKWSGSSKGQRRMGI